MDKLRQTFLDTLRKNQLRITPSRETIWKILVEHGGHISADDLFALVQDKEPSIGRMTVYRTLDLLSQLGLVRPIYQGSGAAHYILLDDGHHHHLICSECHEVIEFDECVVGDIAKTVSERFGFEITGHLLEFYGSCINCRE